MNNDQAETRKDRCAACCHWQPVLEGGSGQCRRHPPAVLETAMATEVLRDRSRALEATEVLLFATRFPVTTEADWCGEFKPAHVRF